MNGHVDKVKNEKWREIVTFLAYEFNYQRWIKDMNDNDFYLEIIGEIEKYKAWEETLKKEIYKQ